MRKEIIKQATQGYAQARALIYTLESTPLPILNKWISGTEPQWPTPEEQEYLISQAQKLLSMDSQDFADRIYPLNLLQPESPLGHTARWTKILADSVVSFYRRRNNETTQFSNKIEDLDKFPDYYKRNFHHQTNGYLSLQSADLYEHQVELLFRGLAEPMRRRILRPMVQSLSNKKNPKILEIACGSGTFTRSLVKTFPQAQITALDMSPYYIQYAKKRFQKNKNVDFIVGRAEELPFKDEHFDAVVSVFMHHELPQKVREKSIEESLRVCRKKAFWGLVDSIQLGDDPVVDGRLKEFPKVFHEPYYTNYIKNSLLSFLEKNFSGRKFKEELHLTSKVVCSV